MNFSNKAYYISLSHATQGYRYYLFALDIFWIITSIGIGHILNSTNALFEVYVTDPSLVENEQDNITEVYYPVKKIISK